METFDDKERAVAKKRRRWETPDLKSVGTVATALKGGGGKISVVFADPGDTLKPKGQA
jgi:hypothetical protein